MIPRASPLLAALLAVALPARAADIKFSTWNLDWLVATPAHVAALPADVPRRGPGDLDRLRAYAEKLDADVVAYEEADQAAAALLFPAARYTVVAIHQDVVQQVGLAVRRPITVRQNPDLDALDVAPDEATRRLRHGLDATLTFPDGATLRVLAVHLKSGCQTDRFRRSARPQCALLAEQVPAVAAWVRARAAEGGAFAVAGDFNRVMDRPEDFSRALDGAAPLTRVTAGFSDPCWGGGAFIDHIFLGGPARAWLIPGSLRVMVYADQDPEVRDRLSDHCPVSVTLRPK